VRVRERGWTVLRILFIAHPFIAQQRRRRRRRRRRSQDFRSFLLLFW
jgi:hypothetical protein